jgi:hypothetical protein
VYKAQNRDTGEVVALKRIRLDSEDEVCWHPIGGYKGILWPNIGNGAKGSPELQMTQTEHLAVGRSLHRYSRDLASEGAQAPEYCAVCSSKYAQSTARIIVGKAAPLSSADTCFAQAGW